MSVSGNSVTPHRLLTERSVTPCVSSDPSCLRPEAFPCPGLGHLEIKPGTCDSFLSKAVSPACHLHSL